MPKYQIVKCWYDIPTNKYNAYYNSRLNEDHPMTGNNSFIVSRY